MALHGAQRQSQLTSDGLVRQARQQECEHPAVDLVEWRALSLRRPGRQGLAVAPEQVEQSDEAVEQTAGTHQQCRQSTGVVRCAHRHHGQGTVRDHEVQGHAVDDAQLLTPPLGLGGTVEGAGVVEPRARDDYPVGDASIGGAERQTGPATID
ncbi:MAG: hypothetical protein M3Y71_03770, partial [Actinomycetota bacterium]|nr:hypothetical protein [Actinomycetota bacterium]